MKKFFTTTYLYIKNRPKIDWIIFGLGLGLFITIALINAPRASIWFDEAFSVYIAQFSLLEIAQFTATDVHPPFYYWLLKIWSDVFGTTELAYRSLSILFAAGAITFAFLISRKLFGRRIAAVTLLFLVLSPMLIRYSDEARMYTLAALLVMAATYVMLKAIETKRKSLWVVYGVLVSLGMWTHYFTALAWIAHWVWRATETWRKGMKLKAFWKKFFTKEWVIAYSVAVGLFIPWLIVMVRQLGVVQSGGFWIGPVGVDTATNFFSNYFYYLEHNQVTGWLALLMVATMVVIAIALPRAYKALTKNEKGSFMLVTVLAWVPFVLLFIASMPPLRSSFVERYLIPAFVALSIFMAVVLVVGTRRWKPFWRVLPIIAVAGMMIFGITNVYKYGNYNKNTNTHIITRQLIQEVQQYAADGEPIVANSPWIFYEAAPYATEENKVYFIDENTDYIFGSLDMLKNRDLNKIKDLDAFAAQYPTIWYFGTTDKDDIAPFDENWQKLQTVSLYDDLTKTEKYKATQYRLSGE